MGNGKVGNENLFKDPFVSELDSSEYPPIYHDYGCVNFNGQENPPAIVALASYRLSAMFFIETFKENTFIDQNGKKRALPLEKQLQLKAFTAVGSIGAFVYASIYLLKAKLK